MLNELEAIRRGLGTAGIKFEAAHPDVLSVSKNKKPLLVRLKTSGAIDRIELLSETLRGRLWTFRDGKHNSFPFVSPPPLLDFTRLERDAFNKSWKDASVTARRGLLSDAVKHRCGDQWCNLWPGRGILESVRRRRSALARIEDQAAAVPSVIDRFLTIFHADADGSSSCYSFVNMLKSGIIRETHNGIANWLEVGRLALVGEYKKISGKEKLVGGDFYFDVAAGEFARDVHDPRNRPAVSGAILQADTSEDVGRCAINGHTVQLQRGNFPQLTLPAVGEGYIFSKNKDLLAAGSYGQFGADAFPVGRLLLGDLKGAVTQLVGEERENVTWCRVPGEKRGTTDLLVAFVAGAPDAPVVGLIAGDDDDESGELDPVAVYERRTERLIEAVKGKAEEDFRCTPVQACLLRKMDEGNRKALLHRHLTVGQLYDCAQAWAEAQRNLPNWLFLLHRKQRQRPQSLTPFSIPALTKRQFVRGGTQDTGAIGISAAEVFGFFIREGDAPRLARRFLHVVLKRDWQLLEAVGHAKHGARNSKLDIGTTLRVLTLLAILLHALGRRGGSWMNEAAFRLGQLLSIADVVHAGYCAAVREGQVPPALLGNAVLAMAQANPSKALAVLARRWPPYASWAKRASAAEAARLRSSEKESDRGWKISQAIWQHRRASEISTALHGQLPQTVDDVFRAELLLGYVAGLSPRANVETDGDDRGGGDDVEGDI